MKRILLILLFSTLTTMTEAQEKIKQTAGRDQLGAFAPEFARLNDDVLFGEVWSRTSELSLRDRSLVTVVALMAQGLTDSSFKYHLESARKNGITRPEIAEILTHAAFYTGWPKAWAAFRLAKEVWQDETAAEDSTATGTIDEKAAARAAFEREMIFPVGQPNDAYARYFIGQSYLAPVSTEQVKIVNVTFEPGCRNNWHIHHATKGGGQTLVCVAGRGWYQEWGKPARALRAGDVVNIPAGVKHWHGAAADSWFAHLAVEIDGENTSNEWLEAVDDAQYGALKE
ncbi:MAG: carboxymuconolactone decarboxylase family protein [Alistipes senegalensis]|nr:carboxymuconolactone decarboxylase family protein [Bacteroides cellulosilyticus]MCM1351217.1 carboxymuconolactone decarboxylase family protein [Alistipes senegalensis]